MENELTAMNGLKQDIANDIAYVFGVFPSVRSEDGLNPLKSRVIPRDRNLVDFSQGPSLKMLEEKSFISPYDILIAKVKDDVTEFYSVIKPDALAEKMLERYPEKSQAFKDRFQAGIDASMQSTVIGLTEEINRCALQGKDVRGTITQVNNVLNIKMTSLEKTIAENYKLLAKYIILWEYQNHGLEKYTYIAEGESCEVCHALDGQVFDIGDAEAGVNFAPMHPHCDCKAGILDKDGNTIALIGEMQNVDERDGSLMSTDSVIRMPTKGERIKGFLSALAPYIPSISTINNISKLMRGQDLFGRLVLNEKEKADAWKSLVIDLGTTVVAGVKYADNVIEAGIKYADDIIDVAEGAGKVGKSVDDILDGTSAGRVTKGSSTQYIKSGGYDKALDDFNSLNPSNVKDIPNGKVGTLPDGRTVNVRTNSSYQTPTLEIYDGSKSIKIRYDK